MNTTIKIFAAAAASFALGYTAAKRTLEQSYMDVADSEIADMKKHYEDKLATDMLEYEEYLARGEVKASLQEPARDIDADIRRAEELETARNRRVFESTPEQPLPEQREYDGPAEQALQSYQIGEAAAYLEAHKPVVVPAKDIPEPFVISVGDFMQAENGWPQYTYTFYEGDNTLINEQQEVVEEDYRAQAVGNCIANFGDRSDDANVVYIRSPHLQTEFEIVREGNTYASVIGFGEEPS